MNLISITVFKELPTGFAEGSIPTRTARRPRSRRDFRSWVNSFAKHKREWARAILINVAATPEVRLLLLTKSSVSVDSSKRCQDRKMDNVATGRRQEITGCRVIRVHRIGMRRMLDPGSVVRDNKLEAVPVKRTVRDGSPETAPAKPVMLTVRFETEAVTTGE